MACRVDWLGLHHICPRKRDSRVSCVESINQLSMPSLEIVIAICLPLHLPTLTSRMCPPQLNDINAGALPHGIPAQGCVFSVPSSVRGRAPVGGVEATKPSDIPPSDIPPHQTSVKQA